MCRDKSKSNYPVKKNTIQNDESFEEWMNQLKLIIKEKKDESI
jgi:hypothetical protein